MGICDDNGLEGRASVRLDHVGRFVICVTTSETTYWCGSTHESNVAVREFFKSDIEPVKP